MSTNLYYFRYLSKISRLADPLLLYFPADFILQIDLQSYIESLYYNYIEI